MKYEPLTVGQIKEIYAERLVNDFAPEEVKPLSRILTALSDGHYVCYGAIEEGEIVAYAFLVIDGRNAMVDYYAVREDLRGHGKGSCFIRMMTDGLRKQFDCVLFESEDPDDGKNDEDRNVRDRRIRFYLHNGLVETGVRTIVWHVHYRILALPVGRIPSDSEIREIYDGIYRAILPVTLYMEMVRIL